MTTFSGFTCSERTAKILKDASIFMPTTVANALNDCRRGWPTIISTASGEAYAVRQTISGRLVARLMEDDR